MTDEENKKKLQQIKVALKRFPEIVAAKKRNYKKKQKIIAAFMPMARKLRKQVEKHRQERLKLDKEIILPKNSNVKKLIVK